MFGSGRRKRAPSAPALPPPPSGFAVDPLATMRQRGVNITSGFRDPAHNRRVGGVAGSDHLNADALDLTPAKGQSWSDLRAMADEVARSHGNGARVVDESGGKRPHIHLSLPGWGQAPGLPAPPAGFVPAGEAPKVPKPVALPPASFGLPNGTVHDGDTFGLTSGANGRLLGVDAFELNQQARSPSGAMIPLGQNAKGSILPFVGHGATFTPNGTQTYGRPVGTLNNGGDAGESLLFQGNALAAPDFLKGNPELMARYMEAERFARLNGRGAFGNTFQTPDSFRAGNPNPWEAPQGATFGEGQAVFADEPTPFMGLRPEIEKGYLAIWQNPASKPEDLIAYAKANGFNIDPEDVRARYQERDKGAEPTSEVQYAEPPRLLTDVGDDAAGAAVRGAADPFNLLDELGGVADTLTGLDGRESIWNSDRRFGDILWNNIDQNRSVLSFDDANHPYARLGGQIGGSLLLPYGAGIRTVGGLAKLGAVEGGLAGFGAGEGNALQRMPNAAAGAALGTAGGFALGGAINGGTAAARRLGLLDSAAPGAFVRAGRDAAFESAPVVNDGAQAVGPTPASRMQPDGGVMAMRMDDAAPEISATLRQRDYINIPPPPPGFVPESPMLRVQDASRMIEVDEAAKTLTPDDVLPLSDFAPDERAGLGTRKFGGEDGSRPVYQRGPVDLIGFIRSKGGIQDQGGELSHLGITNAPRKGMDFADGEQFLGSLIKDDGRTLDDMAEAAWEAGYFPEFDQRPSVSEFLDAVADTHSGLGRRFHPDDFEEVARFEDELAQRYSAEAAEQAEPEVVKVGNVRLDKIESPQDIHRAIQAIHNATGDNPSLARVSHEKTAELAEQLGMTPEHFLKMRRGAPLSHAEAHALGQANAAALEDTVARARKALNGSEEDKAAFLRSAGLTSALTDFASGARAEAGRTLSQYRMIARSTKAQAEAIKRLIETRGGHDSIDEMAQAIIELSEDPAQANRFIQQMTKPNWKDKAVQLLYFVRLSGIRTHAVNIISNTLTALGSLPEHATAAMIGQFRRSSMDRVMASELGPRLMGMISGATAGLKQAKRTFLTGETSDGFNRIEANVMEPIQGPLGAVVRTPGRLLAAEDEFFKSVARFSELNGLAARRARAEGLKPLTKQWQARIDELVKNPPAEMLEAANNYARYQTFQSELGNFGKDLVHLSSRTPALKLVFPFIRTPINLLKYSAERSPAGALMPRVWADFKAGGARRDLALARVGLGSSIATILVLRAAEGLTTGGGPADENEKRLLLANGWQPYSIKVGDKYISYERMDPFATTLGIASDYVEKQSVMTDAQREKVGTLLVASIVNNMASKTWMSGVADISEAIGDPARYGEGYIRNQVAGLTVPAMSSQLAQTVDMTRRETHSIPEAIKQRFPGLSDENLPARNIWGEPIQREGYLGPDIASPFAVSTAKHDPVTEEMQRINARIGKPQRDGMPWPTFNEFQRISGQTLRQSLEARMAAPDWQAMSVQAKQKEVAKLKTAARKFAREQLGLVAPKGDKEAPPPPPAGFVLPPPPPGFTVEGGR